MKIPFFRRISDNSDTLAAIGAGGLPGIVARLQAWNPASTQFNRLLTVAPDADGFAISTKGYLGVYSLAYIYNGASFDRLRTPTIFKIIAAVAVVAGTGAVVWTPGASKKFRLLGYYLSSSAASSLIFCDHVVGTPMLRSPLLAAAGIAQSNDLGNGLLSATANNVLRLDVSANATVTGSVYGTEE